MISKSKLINYLDNKVKYYEQVIKSLDPNIENIWAARIEMWFAVKLICLIDQGEFDEEEQK